MWGCGGSTKQTLPDAALTAPSPAPLEEPLSDADNAVKRDVIEVLRPRGLGARLKRRLGRGMPLGVILDALPAGRLDELAGEALSEDRLEQSVGRQQALRALRAELDELEAAGRVRRGRVQVGFDGRGHGLRQGLIDVWRLR